MRASLLCLALATCLTLIACENTTTPPVITTSEQTTTPVVAEPLPISPEVPFDEQALIDAGLQVYWTKPGALRSGEEARTLYQLDENVYYVTNFNTLVTHSAIAGNYRWRQTIGNLGQTVFAPTHADDVGISDTPHGMREVLDPTTLEYTRSFDAVLINTLSYVVVIDRRTGRLVRAPGAVPFNGYAANAGGVSDGANFFVPSARGWIHTIELATNAEVWTESTDGTISSDLIYADNFLYAVSEDGAAYSFDVTDRKLEWRHQTSGPIVTNFAVRKGRVAVPCKELRLYCFDTVSGASSWTDAFVLPGKLTTPVKLSEGAAYQYCEGAGLYAVSIETGELLWRMPNGRKVVMVDNYKAYVLDEDDQLHVVKEATGEELAVIDFSGFDMVLSNADTPAIYAADRNGDLFCIRPESAGYLTPEMMRNDN
jgi:hypothetical protein